MEYALVSVASLLVAAMALYSGFGLGTLLMPVFAIFFPVPVAVASTAVVHLAHSLFRIGFVGRRADWRVALLFGVPAAAAAIVGALILIGISDISSLTTYHLGGREFKITVVKLVVAALIAVFAVLELTPALEKWKLARKYLPLGGVVSGFFGGLSGHQGALRSAVLLGAGLSSSAFVGTGSVAAMMVDVSRVIVYGAGPLRGVFTTATGEGSLGVVVAAIVSAFAGTYLGFRFIHRVTIERIRQLVGILLAIVAIALASGLV